MSTDIHYVPRTVDLNGLFKMDCPACGQTARVQGNAMGIWIVEHKRGEAVCPASNLRLQHQPEPRPEHRDGDDR